MDAIRDLLAAGDRDTSDIQGRAVRLCLFFLDCFYRKTDARYLNVVLKMLDLPWMRRANGAGTGPIRSLLAAAVDAAIGVVSSERWRPTIRIANRCSNAIAPASRDQRSALGHSVVVFSPSPYSLYTLSVMRLSEQYGLHVAAVVVRKLVSVARFSQEWRRDGTRLLRKVWRKLILRRRAYARTVECTLGALLSDLGEPARSVPEWCRRHRTTMLTCTDLSAPPVLALLDAVRPDLCLFTGGGLVHPDALRRAGVGVLNCHMGMLPHYRGMDVVEWALLDNHPEAVGLTTHLMTKGIDEGPLLYAVPLLPDCRESIARLRDRLEYQMPQLLVRSAADLLGAAIAPVPQSVESGRQHFIMHKKLLDVASRRLATAV